jgi:predicted metalloprotease with PDZ domain
VLAGSAAQETGLSARDEILGVNGWRVRRLDEALQWLEPQGALELLVVRDQRLLTLSAQLPPAGPASVTLTLGSDEGPALRLRQAWLGA